MLLGFLRMDFNTKDKAQAHMEGLHMGFSVVRSQGVQSLSERMYHKQMGVWGPSRSSPDWYAD